MRRDGGALAATVGWTLALDRTQLGSSDGGGMRAALHDVGTEAQIFALGSHQNLEGEYPTGGQE